MSRLLDSHCHIDLYSNYAQIIAATEAAGIETIAVTNTPSVFPQCAALTKDCQFLKPALGFHPELVVQRRREWPQFLELLEQTRFVGEVGLDFTTTDVEARAIQTDIFERILEACAETGDKILTIHSRRAADSVVSCIGSRFNGTAILHWYCGSVKIAQIALENGCYFSFNTAMTRNETGRRLLAAVPKHRVLTETDGPFVQVGSRPAHPQDVHAVVSFLASQWQISPEEAEHQVAANFASLLFNSSP